MVSDKEFEEMLKGFDYSFKKGDLVKGIVYGYDSEGAIVDIGAKMTATVPSKEASTDDNLSVELALEKGKEYEFLIIREEDEDGKFLLSRKRVDLAYTWKELEKIKESDEVIMGTVVQVVKGGLLVDIIGVKGFVPTSQLRSKDTECSVGDKIELKILTMDAQQNNFILSNKKVYSESSAEVKKAVFSQIEIGQIVKGEVVRITDFGAFVDVGGVDCLLPLSQISWRWVEHPTDVLTVGDKIDVEVIDVDHAKQRISLSLKNVSPDPWIEAEKEIKEGDVRDGVITRIKHFGAFVEIYSGVEALLPHAELVDYQNGNNCLFKVGDKVKAKIIKFNPSDKRIALGLELNSGEVSTEEKPKKSKKSQKESPDVEVETSIEILEE